MSSIYQDKILILCIAGSLLSAGILIQRKLIPVNQSSQNISKASPIADDKYKKMQDQIEKLSKQVSALTNKEAPVANTTIAALPMTTRPLRPKNGNQEWLIGKSALADGPDLEHALKNSIDGDLITLEEGIYEISLHLIKAKKLIIQGNLNANLSYRHTLLEPTFHDLTIKNVGITFSDHQLDFISVSGKNSSLTFQNVKINHPKLIWSFRDTIDVAFENSQLSGIALRFSGNSKVKIMNSTLEKSSTLLTLADQAQATISQSHFINFTNVAITSDSDQVRLKADKLNVDSGLYAFWGKFNPVNAQIKDSKFHNLKEFTLTGTTVSCSLCEKYNIQR